MLPDSPELAASTTVPDDSDVENPRSSWTGRSVATHALDVSPERLAEPPVSVADDSPEEEPGESHDAVEVGPDGIEHQGGVAYHAVEVGAGRPIVFLHDLFSSADAFWGVAESLADDWHCLSLDLPGHGRSSAPDDAADLITLVDDVADVLEVFGARPAAVVGHGAGGVLGALLALTHPSAVSSLVLVATDPRGGTVTGEARNYLTRVQVGDRDAADDFFHLLYGTEFFLHSPSLAEVERSRFDALDLDGVGRLADLLDAAPDVRPQLASLDAPVLFVAGAQDRLVPPRLVEETAASLPEAHFDILANVGHAVPVEAPRAFSDLLDRRLLELWV